MAYDALVAQARDELGISPALSARPVQAAFSLGWQLRGITPDEHLFGGRKQSSIASDDSGRT